MAAIKHPILCWKLADDHVLLSAPATGLSAIGSTKRIAVGLLKESIAQFRAEEVDREFPCFEGAELTEHVFLYSARYRSARGTFATSRPVRIPIPVLFGADQNGVNSGYLPTFDIRFFFDNARQRKSETDFQIQRAIEDAEPGLLYGLLHEPLPELVFIRLPRTKKTEQATEKPRAPGNPHLEAVADRFPRPRSVRKRSSDWPRTVWGRVDEVNRLRALLFDEITPVLICGPTGVGKSAVVRQTIRQVYSDRTRSHHPEIWRTDANRLVSGAQYLGDWQEKLESVIEYLQLHNAILWLTNAEDLTRVGGAGGEDSLAAFLRPIIKLREVRIVIEATPAAMATMEKRLPGWASLFKTLEIRPISDASISEIAENLRRESESVFGVSIARESSETARRLLKRFVRSEAEPGRMIRFMRKGIERSLDSGSREVLAGDWLKLLMDETGMPEQLVRDDFLLSRSELYTRFSEVVLGQPAAMDAITDVVMVYKAGLNNPDRPISSLLFYGPTGVGKTATARLLASYCFAKEEGLIRLDMSEFQFPEAVTRFLGQDEGTPGTFLQKLRAKPFRVILLDEIEKAHPVFFDVLLSMLDTGKFVDAYGREIDCSNAVIIMTSNLGTRRGPSLGFGSSDNGRAKHEILSFFRPEFINRIDRMVPFGPLETPVIRRIAEKELLGIGKREGLSNRNLTVRFSKGVIDLISEIGFDPVYGARPLLRCIESEVVHVLARYLLAHPEMKNRALFGRLIGNKVVFSAS